MIMIMTNTDEWSQHAPEPAERRRARRARITTSKSIEALYDGRLNRNNAVISR